MTRTIMAMLLALTAASCGQSPAPGSDAAATADAPPATAGAATASSSDACSLIDDPDTLFGQPVTAEGSSMPNATKACEWKSADGRLCGMVTPFGPGWNEVPDLPTNYAAMVKSMGAFGKTHPVEGVGEEATAVDGGILGAQIALRTSKAIANIAAACGGNGPANLAHAEKIARAIAPKL